MNGTKIKMTMPLITEDDMSFIDNNLNSITKDLINKNIKDRDLALSQYIIKRQYEENEKLKNQQKEFIKWLENEINDYKEVKEVTSDMRHVDYPVSYYIADYSLKEAKRILLEYKKIIMEEENE